MNFKQLNTDSIPHYLDELIRKLCFFISSKVNWVRLSWWGVKFGKHLKTRGTLRIKRLPNSLITIGNNCTFLSTSYANFIGINHSCILSTQTREAKIEIGSNCGFSGSVIGAFKYIKIGNNVRCGANTLITDSDWHLDDPRCGVPVDVIIEDNVWLGINVIVLKGVTIGVNTVIGAGSVVTKSIPANVIAAGNPCKVIKEIDVPQLNGLE